LLSPSQQGHQEYVKNLVDDSITGLYTVKEGTLHFRDLKSYQEVFKKLESAKSQERYKFWEEVNFSSYADDYSSLLIQLSEAKSKEEYNELISQNQDILNLEADGSPSPKAGERFINHFTNRQGLLYIGKVLYKFDKNYQKIAFDGNPTTIKENKNGNALTIFDITASSVKNAKPAATCNSFYKQVTNGDNNRRATVFSEITNGYYWTDYFSGQDFYTVWWNFRVKGSPQKKNIWGNWVIYNTVNHLNALFDVYITPRQRTINCDYSNEWNEITYDLHEEFTYVPDPQWLLNNQTYSFVEVNADMGFYETGGVSRFNYGCD
jgi:hypothetical protein